MTLLGSRTLLAHYNIISFFADEHEKRFRMYSVVLFSDIL